MSIRRVGIIGFGNMGSALAAGLEGSKLELAVADLKPERVRAAEEDHGLRVYGDTGELVDFADVVVIAVKPQDFDVLAGNLKERTAGKLGISIMAGRSIADVRERLSLKAAARFMPNLAATVGRAPVGVAFGPHAPEEFRTMCLAAAGALGTPVEIPERLMPAITGLSGSGLAYVFAFLHAMALGGVKAGFDFEKALEISLATARGAVELLMQSGGSPQQWLARVISPAGTTIQGIAALEEEGMTHAVMRAVVEAANRAVELEG